MVQCQCVSNKVLEILSNKTCQCERGSFTSRRSQFVLARQRSPNNVLLENSHSHSITYCLQLLLCYNRVVQLQQRLCGPQRKKILSGSLQKQFANHVLGHNSQSFLFKDNKDVCASYVPEKSLAPAHTQNTFLFSGLDPFVLINLSSCAITTMRLL